MKNILVTGAAGFIGCNYVRFLHNNNIADKIVSFDKLTYAGNLQNLASIMDNPQHIFIQGDIGDFDLVSSVLKEHKITHIVNFAAETHVDNSINSPRVFFETSVMGTLNLLECVKNHTCRLHHISTDEVYGSLQLHDEAFTENSQYRPNSPYAASKASADHLMRAYFKTYNLPITISNCSNNFGPYQHVEKLIPKVINACLQQQSIPVYGTGLNIRDWLYVEDHCRAIDAILSHGTLGETYNIGGGVELTNLDLIHKICSIMDELYVAHAPHAQLITFVADRKGHDYRYAINNSKISAELSWQPTDDFMQQLKDTILFYFYGR